MTWPRNLQDVDNFLVFGVVNRFRYKNYKGETENRNVVPLCLRYGRTEHYPTDQWLVEAYDIDRNAPRTLALSGIEPR